GKSRESTQSAGLFTALSVWTVARKRQLAAWRGGFMQQRRKKMAKMIAMPGEPPRACHALFACGNLSVIK
ncbi:hypothetical protein, partial [Ralstonia pseudosolanacearum]|uniref:hypothetical protein n=1 Tax=Ralstonia pseudosolanacearum TaxID=1310165 RepID=UPI001E4A91B8